MTGSPRSSTATTRTTPSTSTRTSSLPAAQAHEPEGDLSGVSWLATGLQAVGKVRGGASRKAAGRQIGGQGQPTPAASSRVVTRRLRLRHLLIIGRPGDGGQRRAACRAMGVPERGSMPSAARMYQAVVPVCSEAYT